MYKKERISEKIVHNSVRRANIEWDKKVMEKIS